MPRRLSWVHLCVLSGVPPCAVRCASVCCRGGASVCCLVGPLCAVRGAPLCAVRCASVCCQGGASVCCQGGASVCCLGGASVCCPVRLCVLSGGRPGLLWHLPAGSGPAPLGQPCQWPCAHGHCTHGHALLPVRYTVPCCVGATCLVWDRPCRSATCWSS